MKEIRVTATIQVPRVPNFLIISGLTGSDAKLDVADVDTDSLREIGKAWTDELVEHALKRRKNRPIEPQPNDA